jgi:hypothetical protein
MPCPRETAIHAMSSWPASRPWVAQAGRKPPATTGAASPRTRCIGSSNWEIDSSPGRLTGRSPRATFGQPSSTSSPTSACRTPSGLGKLRPRGESGWEEGELMLKIANLTYLYISKCELCTNARPVQTVRTRSGLAAAQSGHRTLASVSPPGQDGPACRGVGAEGRHRDARPVPLHSRQEPCLGTSLVAVTGICRQTERRTPMRQDPCAQNSRIDPCRIKSIAPALHNPQIGPLQPAKPSQIQHIQPPP